MPRPPSRPVRVRPPAIRSRPKASSAFSEESRDDEQSARSYARPPNPRARKERISKAFADIWEMLFTTPVHLDSALSKQSRELKTILAQIVPAILLRPASQAEILGVGVGPNEPFGLSPPKLAHWRPAAQVADRLYSLMTQAPVRPEPIREDFPAGMVEEWERDWGADVARALVITLANEAPLGLRARRSVGAATLTKRLKEGSKLPVRIEPSLLTPFGVQLSGYAPVLNTELFKEGAFEIQDEGSQLMALFALWPDLFAPVLQRAPGVARIDARPDLPEAAPVLNVIDACAGAGGKTLALADALKGRGRVYAYDTSEKKLQALRRRATHAGLNNIQAVPVTEGAEEESIRKFHGSANVVLVDAPCSGWGVLRRNPDIKWRQTSASLQKMPELQKHVLSVYSPLVAPGGRLIYGVCTFRRAETEAIVKWFLSTHPDFEAGSGGYLGPGPCDGFFMQAFYRRRNPGA